MPTKKRGTEKAPARECCTVESIVTVDERGQMVLPKALRDRLGIRAGDKLAVATWQREGAVCCIALIKAESLHGVLQGMIDPAMKGILSGGEVA